MKEVTTVGIDIAKSVFQVHRVNAVGDIVIRRKLRRSEVGEFFKRLLVCLIVALARGSANVRNLVFDGPAYLVAPAEAR